MEFVNNDSRLLLVVTSHRNITSILNTLVYNVLKKEPTAAQANLTGRTNKEMV